jgi:hypothetical protein
MDALKIRVELRKMGGRELLKLLTRQKISNCLIGGAPCCFHLRYKKFAFCVSEIMGESCQAEKLEKLEEVCPGPETTDRFPPFSEGIEEELMWTGKKSVEFKVYYYKDAPARSAVFLGKVIERRRKERGNNLKDLLNKVIIDYSDRVKNPSAVFLLGS